MEFKLFDDYITLQALLKTNFIKCYISLKGEHKGEQILHRKKVIKSTFDNLKKSQKSTNFNEFSRQGTSVVIIYAFLIVSR